MHAVQVIVFSTAYEANKETSFDHPNIPAVHRAKFQFRQALQEADLGLGGLAADFCVPGRQSLQPQEQNRLHSRSSGHNTERREMALRMTKKRGLLQQVAACSPNWEVKLAWFLGAHTWDVAPRLKGTWGEELPGHTMAH